MSGNYGNTDVNGNKEYIVTYSPMGGVSSKKKNPDYVASTPPASSETTLNADDFAGKTGLQDWGVDWIQNLTENVAGPAYGKYQDSVNKYLGTVEKANEKKRLSSNADFRTSLNEELSDTRGTAARTLASRGTTSSSIGAEYMADLASQTYSKVLEQHEAANQGAATSNYQAQVTQAAAYGDLAKTLKDYLSLTETKTDLDFGDLDFSDDGYTPTEGEKPSGATWVDKGSAGYYKAPDEWGKSKGQEGTVKFYEYDGKEFEFDTATGKVHNITDAATGEPIEDEELSYEDFQTYTGLPEWGQDLVKGMLQSYGSNTWQGYQAAVDQLGNADAWAGKMEGRLNKQYGKLSTAAGSMLGGFARGITGGAVNQGVVGDYASGIEEMSRRSGYSARASNEAWRQTIKAQNAKDRISAYGDLSDLVGDYLGLTRYSYDPNMVEYLGWEES